MGHFHDEEPTPEPEVNASTDPLTSVFTAVDSIIPTLDQLSETSSTLTVISNVIRLSNLLRPSAWTQDKQMSEGIARASADMQYLIGLLLLCQSKGLLQRSQFKSLIHEAEMDIKACANCCDAYLKKNGAVRVIKRTLWREALTRYAARIEHHRSVIMNLLLMQAAVSGRDVTVADIEREMQEASSTQTTYFATTGFDAFVPVPVPTSAESAVIGPSNVQSEAVEAATAESTGPLSELSSACLPPGKDIADVVRDISLGVVQEDELSRYPKDVVQNVLDVIQQTMDAIAVLQPDLSAREKVRNLRHVQLKLALKNKLLPFSLYVNNVDCSKNSFAAGGFADIFKGTYKGHKVAVKRLRVFQMMEQARTAEMLQAFYHESLLWRNLRHKHILPILGINNDIFSDCLCMVMPWMEHGNVRHVIEELKDKQTPLDDLRGRIHRWMQEIASGIEYLHSEGIAHGDLRGPNILIDDDWHARLSDFGLAVFADGASNDFGSVRGGNIRWLPPEVIDPERFGLQSMRPTYFGDIYSFACVCIELYTSKDPFYGLGEAAVLMQLISGKRPPRPSFHEGDEMSADLWAVVDKCWPEQPSERLTAGRLFEQLQNLYR